MISFAIFMYVIFGLAYQGNDIVFRFIIEYIVAEGILGPP